MDDFVKKAMADAMAEATSKATSEAFDRDFSLLIEVFTRRMGQERARRFLDEMSARYSQEVACLLYIFFTAGYTERDGI